MLRTALFDRSRIGVMNAAHPASLKRAGPTEAVGIRTLKVSEIA